jgi:hypothetical protein
VAVVSQTARSGEAGLPRRREPDLADLATFTLDSHGRITSWSVTATQMFGHPARAVAGQDVCDVLMTGPGQRGLVTNALAEVEAGRIHTATVAGGSLGEGRFAVRWEPLDGLGGGAVVIVQRAWPQPAPSWLREAAARIGSSLDLADTANEVAEAAVPGFADVAIIYVAERLLTADELTSSRVAHGAVVRRLAGRHAQQPADLADKLSRPSEVLVLGPATPGCRAMATGTPVLFDRLDGETAERLARHPGAREMAAGYTSYMAMPLIARGVVVGCAIFGRAPASPPFNQGDITLAGELASRAAVCLDNARLYDRERRTAQALQQGLLPGRAKVPDGLEVAHRFLPVGDNVVGGDWHDIVSLPGGRAALIVGDAMGHGPEDLAGQSRPHDVQVDGGPTGVNASSTLSSSVSARSCSSPVGTLSPCFSRIARKRGSSAARSSRISAVARTSTARNPVESSTSSCARLSRRKIAYLARCRVVDT